MGGENSIVLSLCGFRKYWHARFRKFWHGPSRQTRPARRGEDTQRLELLIEFPKDLIGIRICFKWKWSSADDG